MSTVTALAHLEAMEKMAAVPRTQYRHRRLSNRPLLVVPLTMAGEAGVPLAALIGDSRRSPTLLTVGQPRDRTQRLAFAAAFGHIVLDYIDSCRTARRETTAKKGKRLVYSDAPQILVPNSGGVGFLRDLGRIYRFRESTGPYAVPGGVPELGRWLTFLTEEAEQAGTSLLLALTDLLAEHWATGQSPLEDQNLGALMAWVAPPAGTSVHEALKDAEDPIVCPPAGPATSPDFDNSFLEPAIRRLDDARNIGDGVAVAAADSELRDLLDEQLKPTWRTAWNAVAVLRAVPAAPGSFARFARECERFTDFSDYQDSDSAVPQPKRDPAISAARRLSRHERALADYEAAMAFDDPYVLADRRSIGDAFVGHVIAVEPDRTVVSAKNRRVLRPLVTIRTLDPVRLGPDTKLISPSMPPGHGARLVATTVEADTSTVTVEIIAGMGRARLPKPGAVPIVDQEVAYLPDPGWRPTPVFPEPARIPWTHARSDRPGPDNSASGLTDDDIEDWADDL